MHKDNSTNKPAPTLAVPRGRGSRQARLGWMATGIAGGLYLLAIRLKGRINLHALAQAALKGQGLKQRAAPPATARLPPRPQNSGHGD